MSRYSSVVALALLSTLSDVSHAFYDPDVIAAASGLPFPFTRFTAFSDLTAASQTIALDGGVGWTEAEWNYENGGDGASFQAVHWEGVTPLGRAVFTNLGLDEGTWDCYQNHYTSYAWDIDEPAFQAYATLGWTEALWNSDSGEPASAGKDWAGLSAAEKVAAGKLCYFEEKWDSVRLQDWVGPPTIAPTIALTTTAINDSCPRVGMASKTEQSRQDWKHHKNSSDYISQSHRSSQICSNHFSSHRDPATMIDTDPVCIQ